MPLVSSNFPTDAIKAIRKVLSGSSGIDTQLSLWSKLQQEFELVAHVCRTQYFAPFVY